MAKPLAKSLHTITVLVRFAAHLVACGTAPDNAAAVAAALALLGYQGAPDEYGLAERAIATLNKGGAA